MVQSSTAQAGSGDWEVYGVMLRSVLLRGRAALYGAAITGHSVWELLQPAPFNRPSSWEKESVSG